MPRVIELLTSAAAFAYLAILCIVLGLLTRKELLMRGFILLGTVFYALYFFYISGGPLWQAIGASVLIALANLPMIWRIVQERSTFGMSDEMLSLYAYFPNFNPGQFRQMMSIATIHRDGPEEILLQEGDRPTRLFLTISDGFAVVHGTQHAELGPGNFLGEISFVLGGPATAIVVAKPNAKYVVWDTDELQTLLDHSPAMANAVSVLLNKDIARKLSISFPSTAKSILPTTVT